MDSNFCLVCGKVATDKFCNKRCERKYVFSDRRAQLLEIYRKIGMEPQKCALNEILGYSCGMLCSVEEEACDQGPKVSRFCGTKHENLYTELKSKPLRELQIEFLERRFKELRTASDIRLKKLESQLANLKRETELEKSKESADYYCEDGIKDCAYC